MNKLKQSAQLKQKKILSQQTRQAIGILQLNSLDLHKEIENIKYEYLQKNEFFCTPLQRRFYEHRVELLENYILNYLNTTDGKENS